ncbi:hypothetical protein ACK1QP_004636 [Salmonella enterica]
METPPVALVYKSLTHIITPGMAKPENVQEKCSCCERPAEEFNYLGYRLFNSYKQPVIHCPPCQSFFVSAPDIMGIENPRKPTTGQKFGMWSGVGALISVSNLSSVLFAPPGVVSNEGRQQNCAAARHCRVIHVRKLMTQNNGKRGEWRMVFL